MTRLRFFLTSALAWPFLLLLVALAFLLAFCR